MAQMSAEEIINHINDYVAKCPDSQKSHWYVGIATDPKDRLFKDHQVDEDNGWWVYCPAYGENTARRAEKILLSYGYDGGPGGGDYPAYVYAYHKESYTDPSNIS